MSAIPPLMLSRAIAVIVGLSACASTPPSARSERRPSPLTPPSPGAEVAAPPPSACWARGRPQAPRPSTAPAQDGACVSLDENELASVEARVRRDFVRHRKPSKLFVDFACDVATAPARDVFLEESPGDRGFRIVRFRRERDRVAIRVIDASTPRGSVLGATSDLKAFDAILQKSRVALLVRPHLITIQTAGAIGSGDGWVSTAVVRLKLSIVDEAGRITERGFTGRETGEAQEELLPMRLASEPLDHLLSTTKLVEEPATDDDRQMFTQRLVAAQTEAPWLDYVTLAATYGTIDAVPTLVTLLRRPADPGDAQLRRAALDAIAAITGWNASIAPNGTARTVDATIQAVIAGCQP